MKNTFVQNIPPGRPYNTIPAGHTKVTKGAVQEGDLMWDGDNWAPAEGGEVGTPVTSYKAVIRKTP